MTNMLLISSLVSLMTMSMEGVSISYATISTSQPRDANALCRSWHMLVRSTSSSMFFVVYPEAHCPVSLNLACLLAYDRFLTLSFQIIDLRVGEQQFPASNIFPTTVGKSCVPSRKYSQPSPRSLMLALCHRTSFLSSFCALYDFSCLRGACAGCASSC
jgi:hypothetical protein